MDNFNIIYKILKALEAAMDCDEPDLECISADMLKISDQRWERIMIMLSDEGYITGVSTVQPLKASRRYINSCDPEITLKGLEYLSENTLMKKAARVAKGIADMIP